MASAKQIAWRKKFARMSKAGKFKKGTSTKAKLKAGERIGGKRYLQVPNYQTGKPKNIMVTMDKQIQRLEKENKEMREFIRENRGVMTKDSRKKRQ